MTTSNSSYHAIKTQADNIAKALKAASRGEKIANDPAGKIAASLGKGTVKFGVVMDDKVITVEVQWSEIRDATEEGLATWIMNYMRGQSSQKSN